jgi:chemotaxis protein MotA
MEMTTWLGILIGIGGILLGNVIEGGHISSLVQVPAAIIVFSGTFGAVIVSSRREDLRLGLALFKKAFQKQDQTQADKILNQIIDCSRLARKESILAIESRIPQLSDPFLQNVMRSVVDGVDAKVLRDLFEKQIDLEEERLMNGAKIWTEAGGYAPTIGIIGAVLGLIHVMGNLTDTSKLGSGIAVAFVATIYGVGFANLLFLPIGNKLKKWVSKEVLVKEMILEGGICIQSGINPALAEFKLKPFLEKAG